MLGSLVAIKAAAALVAGVFAVIVLWAQPRRSANRFLAVFLLLISGNHVAEVMRSLATDPGAATQWFRIASTFAALDPLFLYAFAAVYPARNRLARPLYLGLVAAGSTLLAALALVRTPIPTRWGLALAGELWWGGFTALIYTVVLVHLTRRLLDDAGAKEARFLVPAVAVATVPAWPRFTLLFTHPLHVWGAAEWRWLQVVVMGLPLLAALAVAWRLRAHPRSDPSRARLASWSLVAGAAVGTVMFITGPAQELAALAGYDVSWLAWKTWGIYLRGTGAAFRWVVFTLLASVAVLRYQMLGISLRVRRRAARVLVALVFLGAAGALISLLQATTGAGALDLRWLDVVVLGGAVLASQGLRRLVDRVAHLLYGVPIPGDLAGAAESYRAAVEQAARQGEPVRGNGDLLRLRDELGLDHRAATLLEDVATTATQTPMAVGSTVDGRYEAVAALGGSGDRRVFLARDALLERDVVLKEVPAGSTALAEARLAGGLTHPNVVTVHDVIEQPAGAVLVVEYVAGGSLAERLDREGSPPRG